MEQHHKINLHDQRPPYFSVLKCPHYFFKSSSPCQWLENAKDCLWHEMLKKNILSYLNNEISIHDFEYVVTTDIWWHLTN